LHDSSVFIFPIPPDSIAELDITSVLSPLQNVCYGVICSPPFQFYSIRYNQLCISMDLNAFSRSTAAHIALFLAFDHNNWSVDYIQSKYSIRMLLVNPA